MLTTMDVEGKLRLLLVLAFCVVISLPLSAGDVAGDEFCEWEAMNITCQPDEIIVLKSARYGRMRAGRCVSAGYGNMGCSTDVTSHIDKLCSGRRQCYMEVSALQRLVRPCPKDLKSYLEVKSTCIKVFIPKTSACPESGEMVLSEEDGTVASLTTTENAVGSESCPWVIHVQPYQRLNVTLIDFSAAPPSNNYWSASAVSLTNQHTCDLLATLSERNRTNMHSVCSQNKRYSSIMVTETNQLEIRFNPKAAYSRFFVIKYEAIGCAPIQAPAKAFVHRSGDHVAVQCNDTDEAWYLTCRGRHWIGELGNCSTHAYVQAKRNGDSPWDTKMTTSVANFPLGILVVVALGVAIGVAMGVFMLVGVLAYMKRLHRRKVRSHSQYVLNDVDIDEMDKQRQQHEQQLQQQHFQQYLVAGEATMRRGGPGGDLSLIGTPLLGGPTEAWQRQTAPLPLLPPPSDTMSSLYTPAADSDSNPAASMMSATLLAPNRSRRMSGDDAMAASQRAGPFEPFRTVERSRNATPVTRSLGRQRKAKPMLSLPGGGGSFEHHPQPHHPYQMMMGEGGPYYFKLDPSALERNQNSFFKPDVIRTCTLCHQGSGTMDTHAHGGSFSVDMTSSLANNNL